MRGALWTLMGLLMIGLAEAQPDSGKSISGSRKGRRFETVAKPAENPSAASESDDGESSSDASDVSTTHSQTGENPMAQAVVVHPSEKSAQQADMETTMPLALNNVPLDQLVRFLADTTGKTVIKQRDINTQVSISAPKPVTKRQALELIYSALQSENIYVAEQDNVLQIVNQNSIRNIKLESIPADVDVQTLPDSLRILQKIYRFQNIGADEVRQQLQMFMSQTAMTVEPRSNSLLMTDQLTRIKSFDKIIQALDGVKTDKVIVTYRLINTNPNDLMMLLQRMIANGALAAAEEGQTTSSMPISTTSGAMIKTNSGGRGSSSNDITLIPDLRFNWLIALCPRAQKAGLDRLVAEFDITKTDDHVVQIYKLKNTDAAQMMMLLNQIISNKGLGAVAAATQGAAAPPAASDSSRAHGPKYWKRMADSMGTSGGPAATQAGDIVLMPEMRQNWIIAIMRPDLKAQLDELVKTFDVERELTVKPRTMDLKGGSAVAMAATITRLVGSLPVTSARDYISVMPTDDGTHLLVFSSEANYKIVEDLIKTVGTVSNDRVTEIFKVKNTDAATLVMLVNSIVSSKGLGKTGSAGAMPTSDGQRHGPGYFRRMAAQAATLGGPAQGGDLILIPESRLNWIIAIMRADIRDEVKALIDQFDVEKAREVQARTIDVASGGATALAGTLTGLLADQPMNSPRDYIRITAQTNTRLIVMSSEANFQVVQDLIKTVGTVPNNRIVNIYKIANTDASALMSIINTIISTKGLGSTGTGAGISAPPSGGMSRGYYRRMMEAMASSGGGSGNDLLMMPDTRQNWIIAVMRPELKAEVEAIIKQFDVPAVKDVSARTIDLKGGNASTMATTLNGLLADQLGGGPRDYVRVTAAPDNTRLIVMSSEANLKTVQDLIATIGDKPNDRILEIYKVKNADCSQLISLFNSIITTKGLGTTSSAPSGGGYSPSSGMSYRGYMRRMMMDAQAASGGGSSAADIMFIPDADKNWIIAIMKPTLKPQLEALLKQFDVPSVKDVTARTIAVTTGTAATMAATLTSLLIDQQGAGGPRDIIRVTAAPDNARLIVTSTEANYQVVQDLLKTVGTISNNKIFEIYHIKNMDAGQLLTLMTPIITSKGLGTIGSATPMQAYSPASGYSYRSYMRRMADAATQAAGGSGSNDMQFIPEATHNWLIAIMKPGLKPDIDKLILQLDIVSAKDLTARTIDITTGTAATMAATLTSLLMDQMATAGPRDMIRVTAAPDNARLLVTSTEANFQVVQDLLKTVGTISNNKIFEIYKIKNLDASQLLTLITPIITAKGLGTIGAATPMQAYSPASGYSYRGYMRRMADAATQASGSSGSNDMQFIPEAGHNWLIAIMKPGLKPEIDKLINQFDVEMAKDITARTIELKGGNAGVMAGTLTSLLADQNATGSPRDYVKVTAAPDNGRLIVMSSQANFKVVQDLVAMVGDAPTNRLVEVYKIKNLDASQLVTLLTPIITSKGLGSIGSSAAMPSFSPSSSGGMGMRGYMRRMMDAQAQAGGGGIADIQFIPEAGHNWLITIMKPTLKTEIEKLIEQFDVEVAKDISPRTIELKGGNAGVMASTLTSLLVDQNATGNPRDYVKVTAAPDNARLIVMSSQANFKVVQDLVAMVGDAPANRIVEIYKVKNLDASQLVTLLSPIITSKGLGTIGSTTAMPTALTPSSSGSSGMRGFMRRMMDAQAAAGGGSSIADIQFIPEAAHNWLIMIMKPTLKTDIMALIKQFDIELAKDISARTVELKGGNATGMAATLTGLLVDQAATGNPRDYVKVTAAPDNTRLIVMSSEANFQVVKELIQTVGDMPNNRVVEVYKITNMDVNTLLTILNPIITNKGLGTLSSAAPVTAGAPGAAAPAPGGLGYRSYMRRMADATAAAGSGQLADITFIPDADHNTLIAIMKPTVKKDVEALIKQFDVETAKAITARTIDLKGGNASAMAATLTSLLTDQNASGNPRDVIRVTPASDNTRLIVMSSEANYQMVQNLVLTIGITPNNRVVEIYKVVNTDANQLMSIINTIITNKGLGTTASGAAAPTASPVAAAAGGAGGGFRSLFQRLASTMSAGSGGPASDLMMIVDPRLNWIIAVMKPDLKTEVDGIVKQFDIESSKDVTARIIQAKTLAAPALATAITALLPTQAMSSPRDYIKVTSSDDVRMVVMSSEANYKLVQELAKTLDDIPDDRVVDIYKLSYADASELIMLLNNVLSKAPMMKGATSNGSPVGTARVSPVGGGTGAATGAATTGAASGAAGGGSSSSLFGGSSSGGAGGAGGSGSSGSSRYSRILGGSSSGGAAAGSSMLGGGLSRRLGAAGATVGSSSASITPYAGGFAGSANAVSVGAVTLIPELRLNWIIGICPRDLKPELDALVKQFDIEKPKDLQPRIVEVKHVDATTLATTLNTLLLQQSATGRREAVRVAATDDGNRLLIWSTENNFKDVEQMIKALDVETTKDVQARLIDVKFAEATNLATTLNNLFNNQYWTNKKEYVRVSATDDGNRLMVMSSEANYKVIEDMIKKLDTQDGENMVTQVYKIEHLEAQALSDQLTALFQARSRANTGSAASMFFGYGYGGGGNQRQSIQQPSIVPSPRTNTVMVMARPKDIPFINDMVKELDVPIDPSVFEPRIYRIHNTDASEVMTVLQDLFSGKATAGASRSSTTNVNYYLDSWRPNSNSNTGDAITQVFGQLRFVVDRMTNTIVALSSNPKNYEILDHVIEKLDAADPENSEVVVYDLKYADALKVANQMNYLFSTGQVQRAPATPQPQQRPISTVGSNSNGNGNGSSTSDEVNSLDQETVQDFVPLWGSSPTTARPGEEERPINTMIGKVRVVPDMRSNKLMIASPPVYFPTLTKLVESLDHNEPQVYITTRILEITRGKEKRVGMRWTPDPSTIDPGEMDNAMLALSQLGFLDSFGHGDKVNPTVPGNGQMTATKTFGAFDGSTLSMSPSLKNGNSIISSQVNIALLVQLLVKNTESRVYTEPGVTVNNNETGNIFFGSEYPFHVNQTTNLNGNNQTVGINYRPVGINLDIRPHINSEDEVVLKVAGENSNVRAELIDGQIIKDLRRFTTDVSLKSGETIVIGGILIDDGEKVKHGVPILSDLPLIKYLFSKNDTTRNIRELVFFVTPTVINSSKDTQKVLRETQGRINDIESLTPKRMDKEQAFEEFPGLRSAASQRTDDKSSSEATDAGAEKPKTHRVTIHADLPEVSDEEPPVKDVRSHAMKDGVATIVRDESAPVIREEKPKVTTNKMPVRPGSAQPGSPVTIRSKSRPSQSVGQKAELQVDSKE